MLSMLFTVSDPRHNFPLALSAVLSADFEHG